MCTVKAKHKEADKPVTFIGTSISEVKDGKITQGWNYFDFLSVHLQTGKIQAEQLV
jgi:predicted ester cyclase